MASLRIAIIGLVLSSLAMSSCIIDSGDSSLTIFNDSDYAIVKINIAPVGTASWGPDILGSGWLYPGDSVTIDYIDCDYYDVRIVDDTYWECIIYDVDFCWNDDYWVITNRFLNNC